MVLGKNSPKSLWVFSGGGGIPKTRTIDMKPAMLNQVPILTLMLKTKIKILN